MKILAWTTTPWTLPSNLALAVGSDIQYSILDYEGQLFVLGEETVEHYESQFPEATTKGTLLGTELLGRKYTPLFDFFADYDPNAFQIISGDFIDTEEGTGIVHIAPGFGEDDQRIAAENQIGTLTPVDDAGCFTSEVKDWEGQNVFEASPDIIRSLRERDKLVRHDSYEHNSPHCWRTATPRIYKAVPSW